MASTFLRSSFIPSELIMNPKYVVLDLRKEHFFDLVSVHVLLICQTLAANDVKAGQLFHYISKCKQDRLLQNYIALAGL